MIHVENVSFLFSPFFLYVWCGREEEKEEEPFHMCRAEYLHRLSPRIVSIWDSCESSALSGLSSALEAYARNFLDFLCSPAIRDHCHTLASP